MQVASKINGVYILQLLLLLILYIYECHFVNGIRIYTEIIIISRMKVSTYSHCHHLVHKVMTV